jgi:hypothetical protein
MDHCLRIRHLILKNCWVSYLLWYGIELFQCINSHFMLNSEVKCITELI